jgi:hypothetical protein
MYDFFANPYKKHIVDAQKKHPVTKNNYTGEKLAEAIDRHRRTIDNYCAGTSIPPEDDVLAMTDYLKEPLLPVGHLLYTSKIARSYMPPYEGKGLAESYVRFLKELKDVEKIIDGLTEKIGAGEMDEEKAAEFAADMKELRDLRDALFGLEYASIADKADRENKELL